MARRYAYALFFRSNIPVNHYRVLDLNVTRLQIRTLDELSPGRDSSMDIICKGILRDDPVAYRPPDISDTPAAVSS